MIITSFDDTKEYVLEADRALPESDRTTFTLRPMSERARRKLENIMGQNLVLGNPGDEAARMSIPIGDLHATALCAGIAGWTNMRDRNGKDVPFKRDANGQMDSEQLNFFTVAQKSELMREVLALNGLSGADEKN